MPHVSLDKFKLYYEDHGQGDPLLLIAGLNCDSRVWTFVLENLKKDYRVIFFDNRGVGKSDKIEAPITIECMANDAFQLLTHLGIDQATVIGHSMGGAIAQTMAYLQPHRISRLVICSSLIKVNRRNRMLGGMMVLLRQCGINPLKIMQKAMPLIFAKQFRKNKALLKDVIENVMGKSNHPQVFVNYKRQLEALFSFDSAKWARQIKSPTLIIEGKEDRVCPRDSKRLAKSIFKSTLISLPNVGHVPMIEQPDLFVQVLIDFLESVSKIGNTKI